MELSEIAKTFDMSVKEFCACFGYTRQSLGKGGGKRRDRREAGMKRLIDLSRGMLVADKEKAERKFHERMKAIEEFEKMIVKAGES